MGSRRVDSVAPMPLRLVCVVGRDGSPVFHVAAPGVSETEVPGLMTVAFAAMDAVDDRLAADKAVSGFLGEVLLFEELRVFALVAVSGVRVLLLGDERDADTAREVAAAVLRRLVEALQNPFQPLRGEVRSPRLRAQVLHLMGRP